MAKTEIVLGESGGSQVINIPLSAISSGNQESANPATNASNTLTTNRYSSNYNQLTYLELTPRESCCVNAISVCLGVTGIANAAPQAFTAKFQGYDGSSWVDLENLSFTQAEVGSFDPCVRKINNSSDYSKYRFTYTNYSTYNTSISGRQYCGMNHIVLMNIG